MIPLNNTQLPPQLSAWFPGGGTPTQAVFFFMRSLFNRTGGNSGIPFTSGSSLVAAGVNQATSLALGNDFNEVTSGSGGVALAMLQPAQFQLVFNGLAGNLNVYPFPRGQINALAVNAPFVLGNGKTQIFWCPKLLASGGSFYRTVTLG